MKIVAGGGTQFRGNEDERFDRKRIDDTLPANRESGLAQHLQEGSNPGRMCGPRWCRHEFSVYAGVVKRLVR